MGAKQPKGGSSVKYGTGQYDKQAHLGGGKSQKLTPPAVGDGYSKPTPHANSAIVRDGVEGHGSPKRGYQQDAHSGSHHGSKGQAVGHASDLHQDYSSELYSEGRPVNSVNPGYVQAGGHSEVNKAEHHPKPSGNAHIFQKPKDEGAHGFGYGSAQKSGYLRMSGHAGAHRIGKK